MIQKRIFSILILLSLATGCLEKQLDSDDLIKAIRENNLSEVVRLVERGVNINWVTSSGYNALHVAVLYGHEEIAKFLISKGARINYGKYSHGLTPLHSAIERDYSGIALMLIENGADVNRVRHKFGWTPMHQAARVPGMEEVVKALFENGADINPKDNEGKTPLDWAVEFKNNDMVNFLSKNGAKAGK